MPAAEWFRSLQLWRMKVQGRLLEVPAQHTDGPTSQHFVYGSTCVWLPPAMHRTATYLATVQASRHIAFCCFIIVETATVGRAGQGYR